MAVSGRPGRTDHGGSAAYLTRFMGTFREHTESDLRCYLAWCAERALDPLAARRPHHGTD
jgi:hypothetical protein